MNIEKVIQQPRVWAGVIVLLAVVLTSVQSCGGDDPPTSSELSDIRLTSKNNALNNARIWKSEVHPIDKVSFVAESDSSIDKDCRFGDGFATVSYAIDGVLGDEGKGKLQCQTYGSDVGVGGCLTNEEFAGKPRYVEIKNKGCDPDIDSMPKL